MNQEFFGTEFFSGEDRAYNGSRFSEVEQALFANPYQRVWGAHGEPPLPVHKVTLSSVLRGLLPFGRPYVFRRVSEREVDSKADLRWGLDRKGYRRILHPNGICLTGSWQITKDTDYSGYFRKGSHALLVGRYSTCCTETRRGHTRFKKVENATAVIWKTLLIAEKTFRRLDAPELLADVARGEVYVNGVRAANRREKTIAA